MPAFLARWLVVGVVTFLLIIYYTTGRVIPWQDSQLNPSKHFFNPLNETKNGRPAAFEPSAHRPPSPSESPPILDIYNTAPPPPPTPLNRTRALIIARTRSEDTSWATLSLAPDPLLETLIYTVDDPHSPNPVPLNKGHEVMPYLTYIITRYDSLPDISIFMHAHPVAWHNNDILDSSSALTVQRLNSEHVLRKGYFNLRCHGDPGCPHHLHPLKALGGKENMYKPEEVRVAAAWGEIFGRETPVPEVLSQPCCGQFAVSRERIRSVPLERYVGFRRWVVETELGDEVAGRVWEYVWQWLWTGEGEVCPVEHVCYCEAYGVCFGTEGEGYQEWMDMEKVWWGVQDELYDLALRDMQEPEKGWLKSPHAVELEEFVKFLRLEMQKRRDEAMVRGQDPRRRAEEAGRDWKEGDGF